MKNISLPEVRAPRFGNDETQDVYIQLIRDMQMQAFKAQGLAAFECSKRAAAIHEAGHAVVETALGEVVTVCRIERKDVIERGSVKEVWLGYTRLERTEEILFDSSSPADMIIIQAVRKHAGLAAETAFDPDARLGSSLDELAMCQMFCNLAGNKIVIAQPPGCSVRFRQGSGAAFRPV